MRECLDCGEYLFTRAKRCTICAKTRQREHIHNWFWNKGILNGKGSGSATGFEKANHMYSHGRSVFRRWAQERLKELSYCCERCGNKIDASVRGTWAGHHKDHNSTNNVRENLEVLCKRCHQVEHKCWQALQGVTTISKESTQEIVEARSPDPSGDDIV
jgi:5-methylcytosine-specific restriction endonuclease McrA